MPDAVVNILLESDSASALQLIHGIDVPKKSRHVEIRLLWIRSQIEKSVVRMKHRAGTENVSDLFTKCLSSQLFFKHRETLGFEERTMPDLIEASLAAVAARFREGKRRRDKVLTVCCFGFSQARADDLPNLVKERKESKEALQTRRVKFQRLY